ncbi:MAG: M48 family metallopeptidase [Candidatus Omnitrophota bacterium]
MKLIKIVICIFFSLGLFGCATTYNPVTGRGELIFISTPTEVSLGKSIAKQIAWEKRLINEGNELERIKKIGKKLAHFSDRQDLEYHFFLVKDKEFNAFAVPGGFIYVNSGLADAANDNELACVIAHEIVHVAARHSVKHLQASLGYQILISAALGGENQATTRQISNMIFNLSQLGYSRGDETLADLVGVKYAYLAGYDPDGMVTFFQKLKAEATKRGQAIPAEIFSSHPDIDKRIQTVEAEIKRLRSIGK